MDAIEKRARELLAAEYERSGYGGSAEGIRTGDDCAHDLETASIRAIIAALTPPEGCVPANAVLVCATRLRRLASAASPPARKAYIKAAEDIEFTVSAARPEVP